MQKRTLVITLAGASWPGLSANVSAASNVSGEPLVRGATTIAAAEDQRPGKRDPFDPNVLGATFTSDAGTVDTRDPLDPNVVGATYTASAASSRLGRADPYDPNVIGATFTS